VNVIVDATAISGVSDKLLMVDFLMLDEKKWKFLMAVGTEMDISSINACEWSAEA